MAIKQIFLHEYQSERWFTNGIQSSTKRNDVTGSDYIIWFAWLYLKNTAHEPKLSSYIRSRVEYFISSGNIVVPVCSLKFTKKT